MLTREELNRVTDKIIGLAIGIHKVLGPGFAERIYEKALLYEFAKNGLQYAEQKVISIKYKDIMLGDHRVDFLVEDEAIVELKTVSGINEIHEAQILSYLKAANKRVGLILNFARATLEIKRVVYKF